MKGVVLYKSRYGHSSLYAKWIAEELDFELKELSSFKKKEINEYQTIIFGSGVYMNRLNAIKYVLKMFQTKPIIIFACAGNDNVQSEIDHIVQSNFSKQEITFHTFFYLPGGVDFTKVKGFHKIAVNAFLKLMRHKKNKTHEEQAIVDSFSNSTYLVDRRHITSLIAYVKSII